VSVTANATTIDTMDDPNMASRLSDRLIPIAMAVAIVPGPVVSGMVNGKKAMRLTVARSADEAACASAVVGAACSMDQPVAATTSPPAMRSAGTVMPKKFRIWLPRNSETSSTAKA